MRRHHITLKEQKSNGAIWRNLYRMAICKAFDTLLVMILILAKIFSLWKEPAGSFTLLSNFFNSANRLSLNFFTSSWHMRCLYEKLKFLLCRFLIALPSPPLFPSLFLNIFTVFRGRWPLNIIFSFYWPTRIIMKQIIFFMIQVGFSHLFSVSLHVWIEEYSNFQMMLNVHKYFHPI